jgi:hypothetical protein
MMAGKLSVHLGFKPLSCFDVLTCGAMAIAARAVDDVELSTLFTLVISDACLPGVARNHGIEGFSVLSGHLVAKVLDVFLTEGLEDLIYRGHDRAPPSPD